MIQCQNDNVFTQYVVDKVRVFDFRVRMVNNEPSICHGLADFSGNIMWEAFEPLQSIYKIMHEQIYVQLVNEDTFHHSSSALFREFATFIRVKFPDFKYCIVSSMKNWEHAVEVNEFPQEESFPCFWRNSRGLIPRPHTFAENYNRENLKHCQEADSGIWWFDFINTPNKK